jgi:hypothetical protein
VPQTLRVAQQAVDGCFRIRSRSIDVGFNHEYAGFGYLGFALAAIGVSIGGVRLTCTNILGLVLFQTAS